MGERKRELMCRFVADTTLLSRRGKVVHVVISAAVLFIDFADGSLRNLIQIEPICGCASNSIRAC